MDKKIEDKNISLTELSSCINIIKAKIERIENELRMNTGEYRMDSPYIQKTQKETERLNTLYMKILDYSVNKIDKMNFDEN